MNKKYYKGNLEKVYGNDNDLINPSNFQPELVYYLDGITGNKEYRQFL